MDQWQAGGAGGDARAAPEKSPGTSIPLADGSTVTTTGGSPHAMAHTNVRASNAVGMNRVMVVAKYLANVCL